MIARAPGKLVLSGAYAVLDGAPAIVAAVDRYATADTSRPAPLVTNEVAAAIAARVLDRAPWFDASPLRAALANGSTRKLGLGSSSAILVASIGAALAQTGLDSSTLQERAFERAVTAHRAAQGGGSGIDVAASAFGGVLVARLGAQASLEVSAFALPDGLRVVVFASATSAVTSSFVGAVRAFATCAPEHHARLLDALTRASTAATDAREASTFVACLASQYETLTELGDAAGVPIVPVSWRPLVRAARAAGAAFGPSGAGGGDVAVFVSSFDMPAHLVEEARAVGLEVLELTLGARGLHVV